MGICDGRIVIVTGAGRGIGREHALAFARQGAQVVVNDLGVELDGTGRPRGPAQEVVDEIVAGGGEAVANSDDIADWDGARRLVQAAIDTFGGLDVLVNNAGFVRDRMVVTPTEDEWDAVIRVHLKGHFARPATPPSYWREQSKAGSRGRRPDRQHVLGRRAHGQRRPGRVLGGEGAASPRSRSSRPPRWGATA